MTATTANETVPPLVKRSHPTRWIGAAISIVVLGAIVYAFSQGQIGWSVVGEYVFSPRILRGLGNTIIVSFLAMALGLLIGFIVAMMRLSPNPVTNNIARLFVWFFRGTPLYLQLLLWFNLGLVFPTVWSPFGEFPMTQVMTTFTATLLGLGINEGAYLAEVIRGGILSVDPGQAEAGHAIGLGKRKIMWRIVVPQAMPTVIPTIGNEAIGMLKNSSLAAAISFTELLTSSQQIYFLNGRVMELLFVASIWYLVMTSITSIGQYYLERHFNRSRGRKTA